jgi:hypothetical protein
VHLRTYRRQEAGIFITEMYSDWLLPFLVKQIQQEAELIADLEPDELQMLQEAVANLEALKFAKTRALGGKLVQQGDIDAIKIAARSITGKMRRKGFTDFADLRQHIRVHIGRCCAS